MSNKYLDKITNSSKIIILFVITLIIIFAKSIFLFLFILTLTIIIAFLSLKSVKEFVNILKKVFLLLLFFILMYIMIYRNALDTLIFGYKMLNVFIIIGIFISIMDLKSLHEGLYTLLKPLKKLNFDIYKISYSIASYVFFLVSFLKSRQYIIKFQLDNGIKKFNLKNYILPRLLLTTQNIKLLENQLKSTFYKVEYEKNNITSYLTVFSFLILFVLVVFKEVIL